MKNIIIELPHLYQQQGEGSKTKQVYFYLTKKYYSINGEKTNHNIDTNNIEYYTWNQLQQNILVTLFYKENILKGHK